MNDNLVIIIDVFIYRYFSFKVKTTQVKMDRKLE